MAPENSTLNEDVVLIENADAASSVIVVCEHASNHIPEGFDALGLTKDARHSHAAWDPGALAVARHLSKRLDAVLIAGTVSRLIYDLNRPPSAPDAMPARSEIFEIPGNADLSEAERTRRADTYYHPFRYALKTRIARTDNPVIVTVHSFTPVYHGKQREVEIGILHDQDARLADAMLATGSDHSRADTQRNQPYGPDDGVTHTLREHALPGGHLNVMLEIRNDLIRTEQEQIAMAETLSGWIAEALARSKPEGDIQCEV